MWEDEGTDAVVAGMEPLSNKGGDTGLTGTMMVVGGGWTGINVGDGLERVVADGQEASGTSGVEDD